MLWPMTAERDAAGRLIVGGVAISRLAEELGTPLYVYDEATIRAQCAAYRELFSARYPCTRVVYAAKAYLSAWLLRIIEAEGLWLDVVSGGELYLAHWAGFPLSRVIFHGNNKTEEELRLALTLGVGEIVVDNHHELDLLERIVPEVAVSVDILLRINPGVDVHTHAYRKTGIVDSKFGLLIEPGDAAAAVERAKAIPGVRLKGYHAHIGSQILETEPFVAAIDTLSAFAADMWARHGVEPVQISPGGGWGIQYASEEPAGGLEAYADAVAGAMLAAAARHGFAPPLLTVEPGRSIVGPAGVAVYRVGAIKEIPGIRRYVSVDGGMADNIRPALYGARYEAVLANRVGGERAVVTIAGKYCESGDVLIRDIEMDLPVAGDLVAIPAAGAYSLAMASNYNMALRPAVAVVNNGDYRVGQRRERYEDLVAREMEHATGTGTA